MSRSSVLFSSVFVAVLATSCGVPVEDSRPLVFIAPLVGSWTLETDTDTELQFSVPDGQPLYVTQFEFSVDEVTLDGSTALEGSADGRMLEFRDPSSGAVLLTGELVENTMILLSDGRRFTKVFAPDLLSGQWVDVNAPTRIYRFDRVVLGRAATGCARATNPKDDNEELQGDLDVIYDGDVVSQFRVRTAGGLVTVRSPGIFIGVSAMRILRIEGFLHLQRKDASGTCEDLSSP